MTARPAPLSKPVELTTGTSQVGSPVPSLQKQMIVTATVCNKTSSAVTMDLWIVAPNESPLSDNKMLEGYSISGNDTAYLPLSGLTLDTGYTIHARADTANALNLFISIWKITET